MALSAIQPPTRAVPALRARELTAKPLDSTGPAALAYWMDVEALSPPSLLEGASRVPQSRFDWGAGSGRGADGRVENTVFLGVFSIAQACDDMADRLGRKRDFLPERQGGASYLGSCSVGSDGRVRTGSFSPTTFALRFETLRRRRPGPAEFERRRAELRERFDAEFAAFAAEGGGPALTHRALSRMTAWLCDALRDAPGGPKSEWRHSRIRRGDEEDEGPAGDGHYLADLHRAADSVRRGVSSPPLAEYLASSGLPDRLRRDADDPAVVSAVLDPRRMPAGKWPGRGGSDRALVLRQQMAVNEALAPGAALVGVNGPPGTGKSTLLRDVAAAVLASRAEAMAGFDDPASAFSEGVEVRLEKGRATAWRLHPRLRGFGVLVCSSNNTAVANITRELPMLAAIAEAHRRDAETMRRLDFFRDVSDALAGGAGRTWGLVSAELGKAANRRAFLKEWWPEDGAARNLVEAVVVGGPEMKRAKSGGKERLEAEARVGGEVVLLKTFDPEHGPVLERARQDGTPLLLAVKHDKYPQAGRASLVVSSVDPEPKGVRDRLRFGAEDWGAAVERYRASRRSVEVLTGATADLREVPRAIPRVAVRLRDTLAAPRPGFLARLWARLRGAADPVADLQDELRALKDRLAAARGRFAAPPLPAEALQGIPYDEGERSSPWNSAELDAAREELFAASVALHKAFLAAAAGRAEDNLDLMARMLSGRDRDRIAKAAGPHLWDTFFMAVPVVSSTFASVATMFGDSVGAGEIGWLLMDEAGQAVPQAAVGALWRSRRALVVGDPKQIEPVCPVPASVTELLAAHHGVEDRALDPRRASAQSLADRRSALGAAMGRGTDAIWVGCPLRVHRRCAEPMFSISNRISYAGSMVLGRPPLDTPSWKGTRPEYGPGGHPSAWFDMPYEPEAGNRYWVASQGKVVLNMLLRMAEQHASAEALRDGRGEPLARLFLGADGMPEAFVVTPFRGVKEGMARLVTAHAEEFAKRNPAITSDAVFRWARGTDERGRKSGDGARIGTLHAFQGKESPTVFLLLGASPASRGAVRWAGETPNLLNVAATRAKEALYVVGGHRLWTECGPFRSATSGSGPALPVYEVPEFVGTVPDPDRIERIDTLEGHLDVLRRAFEEAKEVVRISSPYLTPKAVAFSGLPIPPLVRRAVDRGVKVVVFNDPAMASVPDAHRRAWSLLAEAGAEMVAVSKVHAKTLCVDDKQIVEGSFNWLSAVRDGEEHRHHECSFRYLGRMAPELVARAVEQMSRREAPAPGPKSRA